MDTGILGASPPIRLDAVGSEAQAVISAAADRVRSLAHELRVAYRETLTAALTDDERRDRGIGQGDHSALPPARALIERLELTGDELDDAVETIGSAAARHAQQSGHASPDASATASAGSTRTGGAGPSGGSTQGTGTNPSGGAEPRGAGRGARSDAATARAVLAGQEQERARLAAELHDGPAQALANAIFQAEVVGRAIQRDPAAAEAELAALRALIQRELDALRAYINQLRPALAEPAGLEDALREGAAELAGRAGIPVDVRLDAPAAELDEASRAVVLRIAQEAMRNTAKHAAASRAWVVTRLAGGEGEGTEGTPGGGGGWILEVGDDGRGFDVAGAREHPSRRHFGLRFMHERAQLLGAQLSIETAPAAGTVVRLTINQEGKE